jgi:hypothetical protein
MLDRADEWDDLLDRDRDALAQPIRCLEAADNGEAALVRRAVHDVAISRLLPPSDRP